ncbi:hypothetical protein, partial [Micromonospora sp. NPDC005710]|uniref:hypothetical protein n=1 Tax=Micromonospora sp. NPDC005710 TaxID=3157051 RepID=UPI0033D9AF3B
SLLAAACSPQPARRSLLAAACSPQPARRSLLAAACSLGLLARLGPPADSLGPLGSARPARLSPTRSDCPAIMELWWVIKTPCKAKPGTTTP